MTNDTGFISMPFLGSGLTQTLLPSLFSQQIYLEDQLLTVELNDGDKILLIKNNATSDCRGKILIVPGLGTSAFSDGPSRLARKLNSLGYATYRFNHRGLGRGRKLAKEIYHAGRSHDVEAALAVMNFDDKLLPLVALGFSLGGNILLRHAGRASIGLESTLPEQLKAIVALSPILNLEACAKGLSKGAAKIIDKKFVNHALSYVHKRHRTWPELGEVKIPFGITLSDFDQLYTAVQSGFKDAKEYYDYATAKTWLHHINVPTKILMAENDPLGIGEDYRYAPQIQSTITKSGGHLGFICKNKTMFRDYFWMDEFIYNCIHQATSF